MLSVLVQRKEWFELTFKCRQTVRAGFQRGREEGFKQMDRRPACMSAVQLVEQSLA